METTAGQGVLSQQASLKSEWDYQRELRELMQELLMSKLRPIVCSLTEGSMKGEDNNDTEGLRGKGLCSDMKLDKLSSNE
jgi:hypothetical protein